MNFFRLIALGCLFSTAAVPLIVSVSFVFPFIGPKVTAFRALTDLAVGAWLVWWVMGRFKVPSLTPICTAFAIILISLFISDCMSQMPFLAFLSRSERMEGFVTFLHLGAFVFVASVVLDTEPIRRRFFAAQLLGSLLVGVVGWLSYLSFALNGRPAMQVFSTLGNPVFLGQYAALMCCMAAFLMARTSRFLCCFWGFVFFVNFSMIYMSQSRGAAVAAIVGAAALVFLVSSPRVRLWGAVAIGAAIFALIVGPLLNLGVPRLRQITDSGFDDPRFWIWGIALKGIAQRPVFGWGQEGFLFAGGAEQAIDRAHNLLFDWLIVGGVFGAAAWGWFLWCVRGGIARAFEGGERAALYAFLVVYLVTNMFLFDTLTSYLALSSVAAVVAARWRALGVPVKVRYFRDAPIPA